MNNAMTALNELVQRYPDYETLEDGIVNFEDSMYHAFLDERGEYEGDPTNGMALAHLYRFGDGSTLTVLQNGAGLQYNCNPEE